MYFVYAFMSFLLRLNFIYFFCRLGRDSGEIFNKYCHYALFKVVINILSWGYVSRFCSPLFCSLFLSYFFLFIISAFIFGILVIILKVCFFFTVLRLFFRWHLWIFATLQSTRENNHWNSASPSSYFHFYLCKLLHYSLQLRYYWTVSFLFFKKILFLFGIVPCFACRATKPPPPFLNFSRPCG